MKKDTSIDLLRIFAAFAVVVIHVSAYYTRGDTTLSNSFWWLANTSNSFSRWSVPIFIMISGSLLINEKSFKNTNLFFKKRVQRLLIPIFFWSVFFIGFNKYITDFFSIKDVIGRLFIGEPYYHLWYLFLIVGIYCVTPVISLVYANFSKKDRIIIIICIFIAGAINSMWFKYFGQSNQFFAFKFLPYLGYFMVGKEISTSKISYNKYTYLLVWFFSSVLIAITTGLLRYIGFQVITFFYDYLNPLVIVQSISFYVFMKKMMSDKNLSEKFRNALTKLSILTLGIYIIHPIFIELGVKIIENNNSGINFILLPIFAVVVFFVSGFTTFVFTKIPFLRKLV
jgi:surface polysaccharide O-acyltransferase-like enzyme